MKVKKNKIIIFLLIIVTSFFSFIPKTNAIKFTTASSETSSLKANPVYCDKFLQYSNKGVIDYVKYAVIGKEYRKAYCANQGKSFTSSSKTYNANDQGYAKANTCKYWYEGVEYTGDCSRIIGYIISTAESKKTNEKEKWMLTQASVWIYLGTFVPQNNTQAGFNIANTAQRGTYPVKYIWENNKNKEAIEVIKEAWKKYKEAGEQIIYDNDLITVERESLNFNYHVENTNSCNTGGYYKTKNITIKNNTSEKIKLSINTNDASPVSICISGTTKCTKDHIEQMELAGNANANIYLKSDNYRQNIIKITIIANYEQGTVKKTTYDSVRWNTETTGTQGMLYLTTSETSANIIHQEIVDVNFNQLPMAHKNCADNYKQSSSSLGTQNTPIGKNESLVCAGTGTTYKFDNSTDSNVKEDLTYCTCKTIDLGNERYVNITLTQNVAFKYGNVTPTKVYSGGGFGLSTEGITTDYMSTVVWDYSDYLGDVPYYYNKNNIDDYNARNIESEIDAKVKKMLEDNLENVEIIFNTYDSNIVSNGKGENVEYRIKLKENANEYNIYKYDKQAHTYVVDIQQIILKEAFFNGNGEVFYNGNTEAITSGGNKYYVPLYYNQNESNQFKFNISPNTNISLIEGIDYYIEAECNVGVEYKIPEIRYRTISVSNPFPKGEETIPSNWSDWWSNRSFQNRIKNTYKTLDYKLELTRENTKIVADINEKYLYTDWNLMNDNGSSNLVNDPNIGFEFKSNISASYCPLGKSDYIINGKTYKCEKK